MITAYARAMCMDYIVDVTILDKLVWTSSTFLIWISGGSFQALNSDQ